MNDAVYRELTILARDFGTISSTLWALRKALREDERFATLAPIREMAQPELFDKEPKEKKGLEDQPSLDPFSVPLERSYD